MATPLAPRKRKKSPLQLNNPLCLEISRREYAGEVSPSESQQFKQFATLQDGIFAAMLKAREIINAHSLNVERFLSVWAGYTIDPDSMRFQYYALSVCRDAHVGQAEKLQWWRRTQITRVLWAMAFFEAGARLPIAEFEKAYDKICANS